jgi:hypothetical protein
LPQFPWGNNAESQRRDRQPDKAAEQRFRDFAEIASTGCGNWTPISGSPGFRRALKKSRDCPIDTRLQMAALFAWPAPPNHPLDNSTIPTNQMTENLDFAAYRMASSYGSI